MAFAVDTNVLLRLADQGSPEHPAASNALASLLGQNVPVLITAQVLVEFWAVATRPEQSNGLGWTTALAATAIRALRDQFPLLDDTPEVLDRWLELVDRCQVSGKRTHDARLAALVLTHDVKNLLTFNTADFPTAWGIKAVHPADLPGTLSLA